jgi:hydrogenase expression/formation protein HypE
LSSPRFFSREEISVNDLLACGATPLYLSTAFIIEEGLPLADLRVIAASMAQTAREVGVKLVTGDTKVVEKGSADGVFINTTGIGIIPADIDYRPQRIQPQDQVIVTGCVGDHGLAILARREGLAFSTPVVSDCAALIQLREIISQYGNAIRCMRDPTRGGLATVLNEIAVQAGVGIHVKEADIPVAPAVQGACDLLGMDPLYMANEGKMVIFVAAALAQSLLNDLRRLPQTQAASIIGQISAETPGMVLIETELGAQRILGILEGEHVPRIC